MKVEEIELESEVKRLMLDWNFISFKGLQSVTVSYEPLLLRFIGPPVGLAHFPVVKPIMRLLV